MQGPCLRHCYTCSPFVMVLSHISLVYIIASIVYLMISRFVGTPFKDSLTEEQEQIKKESAHLRAQIFVIGILIAFISVYVTKPFK